MRDAVHDLQSHQFTRQQPQSPTSLSCRNLAATQGHQLRLFGPVKDPLTRWATLLLAFQGRVQAVFHTPLTNGLDHPFANVQGLYDLLVSPARTGRTHIGLQQHLGMQPLAGGGLALADQRSQPVPFVFAQSNHVPFHAVSP